MDTSVNSSAPQYFRCYRLAATITPHQCRLNRERTDGVMQHVDPVTLAFEEFRAPCLHCPQAPQVDSGHVRLFSIPQVVRGRALREPSAEGLPGEVRFSAEPYEPSFFTSHHWVPEWDY